LKKNLKEIVRILLAIEADSRVQVRQDETGEAARLQASAHLVQDGPGLEEVEMLENVGAEERLNRPVGERKCLSQIQFFHPGKHAGPMLVQAKPVDQAETEEKPRKSKNAGDPDMGSDVGVEPPVGRPVKTAELNPQRFSRRCSARPGRLRYAGHAGSSRFPRAYWK
jgi:hypothetical protein